MKRVILLAVSFLIIGWLYFDRQRRNVLPEPSLPIGYMPPSLREQQDLAKKAMYSVWLDPWPDMRGLEE